MASFPGRVVFSCKAPPPLPPEPEIDLEEYLMNWVPQHTVSIPTVSQHSLNENPGGFQNLPTEGYQCLSSEISPAGRCEIEPPRAHQPVTPEGFQMEEFQTSLADGYQTSSSKLSNSERDQSEPPRVHQPVLSGGLHPERVQSSPGRYQPLSSEALSSGQFQTLSPKQLESSQQGRFQTPAPMPLGLTGPWDATSNGPPVGCAIGRAENPHSGKQPQKRPAEPDKQKLESLMSNGSQNKEPTAVKPLIEKSADTLHADQTKAEEECVVFPKELTMMFGAVRCALCSVEVNSTLQAKMHYSGRTHDKNIAKFMQKWSKETGEPLAKRFKEGAPKKKDFDNHFEHFCTPCQLTLTSKQHAEQHFMGRNHKRALAGNGPLKGGYFDKALGKWVRTPPVSYDPTGRFHIGTKFLATATPTDDQKDVSIPPVVTLVKSPFFCELCSVRTTSQEQLDTHYSGAKHKRAMKAAGNGWSLESQKIPPPAAQSDSILASVVRITEFCKDVPIKKDYSIYRTPSGQYYCQPCNYTLNSEAQFGQHCESKKHKQKVACVKKPV